MLMDMTVKEFIDELASNSPASGGGSVAALSGALAAALASMVAQPAINMMGAPEPRFSLGRKE
jgi:formiminotetrahydrofolate cyclodeaminase